MKMEIEIDEQKVLDSMDTDEILRKSGMSAGDCKDFFEDKLLGEFTIADIIAYQGEEAFLNEIGEGAAKNHFQ